MVYLDIGHSDPDAILWIWFQGKIHLWSVSEGMHSEVFGPDANKYWRGRYDPRTGRVSVAIPQGTKYKAAPSWLMDALEAEFGGDVAIATFNPSGKLVRITE